MFFFFMQTTRHSHRNHEATDIPRLELYIISQSQSPTHPCGSAAKQLQFVIQQREVRSSHRHLQRKSTLKRSMQTWWFAPFRSRDCLMQCERRIKIVLTDCRPHQPNNNWNIIWSDIFIFAMYLSCFQKKLKISHHKVALLVHTIDRTH